MKDKTLLTHSGLSPHDNHGIVNPPVYHASTILYPTLAQFDGREDKGPYTYGRKGTPTIFAFEEAVAALEQGDGCVTAPSGLGAITLALQAVTAAGDHILVSDNSYSPTRLFLEKILTRFGVSVTYFDATHVSALPDLIEDNTVAIWMESPGSQTFEMTDVRAIVEIAQSRDIITLIDNTWSGGYFFKPLTLGVDISVQAATKYIVGHSDTMMGVVTCNAKTHERVRKTAWYLGVCAGPDDIYLAQRGLRTMAIRMEAHFKAGLEIAHWLEEQDSVERVLHPALPQDPGHHLWKQDFTGACGLFGFVMKKTNRDALAAMLDHMKIFGMGYSWGGYESLLIPADPRGSRSATDWNEQNQLMRIHVGLEDVEDLKADLKAGFERLKAAI